MNRTHIYVIPEAEIGADVGLYDSFIRKYHKVEFVLSKEAYQEYTLLYPAFKEIFMSGAKPTESEIGSFVEKASGTVREAISNVFAFLMVAVVSRYKLSYNKSEDNTVTLCFTNI